MPGDIIYTPIWHPGQTQHFAIAGFIDFDNDLKSDRDKLKDIINYNGGVIDAEMDDKGKVTGRVSNLTQYLILGSPPSENEEEMSRTGYTVLNREAKTYGVPTMKLDAFLAQIGYSVRPSVTGRHKHQRSAQHSQFGSQRPIARRPPAKPFAHVSRPAPRTPRTAAARIERSLSTVELLGRERPT